MKSLIKKIVPKQVFSLYHLAWAFFSALFYGFPSKDMVVIGITGTKGKSTTVYLLAKILEEAGLDIAVSSSLIFKIKEKEWVNPYHMTMVGRHRMQKLFYNAKKAGCKYVIVEVTSEGIAQSRHKFIDFDIVVFTNLSEEHLETHGGFENYKKIKGKLFKSLENSKKKIIDDKKIKKGMVVNADDENSDYFLSFFADRKYTFGLKGKCRAVVDDIEKCIAPSVFHVSETGSSFILNDCDFNLHLLGEFNAYNTVCAIACSDMLGVDYKHAKKAIEKIKEIPGRMKFIKTGQKFSAIVDLAHTPSSFEAVFETVNLMKKEGTKIISLFGAAGGGRDKWKRPELGRIAAENSDVIILANEDPYDENPKEILQNIKEGIDKSQFSGKLEIILDRKEAIKKAISQTGENDIVLFLGKGTERTMVLGKEKIPWNEERIVLEEIRNKISFED